MCRAVLEIQRYKKGPSHHPEINTVLKKQLNFWSSDVLNSKMGIILKKKKCEPKDQVSEGDDTTASVLFNELVQECQKDDGTFLMA